MRKTLLLTVAVLGSGLMGLTTGIWVSRQFTSLPAVDVGVEGIPEVTVTDLGQGDLQPVVLIDVRYGWERALDRIEPSLWIPLPQIESGAAVDQIRELVKSEEPLTPTVVLYCAHGVRSARAQQHLAAVGIKTVSLQGGITAWRQALPSTQEQILTQQIPLPLPPHS